MEAKELLDKLKELAPDGKISCLEARQLAEKIGVPYNAISKACNEARIKIFSCELGCF